MEGPMMQQLIETARKIWQAIGPDVLEVCGEDVITGADVIDVVADKMYDAGFYGRYAREAAATWKTLSYKERRKVLKAAFPDKEYC